MPTCRLRLLHSRFK